MEPSTPPPEGPAPREVAPGVLRAVPLGGLGRIGGNMMVYETDRDLIIVDCGVSFPGPSEPGVGWIVPDVSYVLARRHKLRAYVLTHGHEDHIGALPFVLPELPAPVYGSSFTLTLVQHKLAEHGVAAELHRLRDGVDVELGGLRVTPIPVTHSIPGAFVFALHGPPGVVVHTGDFKLDPDPLDGRHTGTEALEALGDAGVAALFSDSTNALQEGHTWSEREVGEALRPLIAEAPYRVLVTTFASNIYRLQSVIAAAEACGRHVVTVGRSAQHMTQTCLENGVLHARPGTIVELELYDELPRERVVVLASGCQAEEGSAFGRVAHGRHGALSLNAGDRVILSARRIPGNERAVGGAINALLRAGIDVIDDRKGLKIHTSGHAMRAEQQRMLEMVRPSHFVPMHGERRHLQAHAELAARLGATVHLMEDGTPLELLRGRDGVEARLLDPVEAGDRYLDGNATVPTIVLRDRRMLAAGGFVSCAVALDGAGRLCAPPQVVTRGVVYVDESAALLERVAAEVTQEIAAMSDPMNDERVFSRVRSAVQRVFRQELARSPVVVPAVLRVGPPSAPPTPG